MVIQLLSVPEFLQARRSLTEDLVTVMLQAMTSSPNNESVQAEVRHSCRKKFFRDPRRVLGVTDVVFMPGSNFCYFYFILSTEIVTGLLLQSIQPQDHAGKYTLYLYLSTVTFFADKT